MFRKPSGFDGNLTEASMRPSTGRSPTPPPAVTRQANSHGRPVMTITSKSPSPALGRSQTTPKNVSRQTAPLGKSKGKSNGSILNFFKKADASGKGTIADEEDLFFADTSADLDAPTQVPTPPQENGDGGEEVYGGSTSSRFNEFSCSVKRRRTESRAVDPVNIFEDANSKDATAHTPIDELLVRSPGQDIHSAPKERESFSLSDVAAGPFIEDSESEDEMMKHLSKAVFASVNPQKTEVSSATPGMEDSRAEDEDAVPIPSLRREATSVIVSGDGFEGIEDFIDDEFPEDGEEYMERRWMDEQQRLEMGLEEVDGNEDDLPVDLKEQGTISCGEEVGAESCPICSASLSGISPEVNIIVEVVKFFANVLQQASLHVNRCLDGNPLPVPKAETPKQASKSDGGYKKFQRAAIPRPGQSNPFSLGSEKLSASSAFSKLMSSHAEDTAWATAAASEMSSRGKAAYQRTCPFYKIMPGFFICVDAFRYGAVQGCNAYFLSHFHSDHYIGLTSSWCHGPIYCSKVTGNLVRRQLRVDPKWVMDLEFDRKIEVPMTQGVTVTMIPANHCPGSSLFLFEKLIGQGKTPKFQRVLHCGDFRACPAHVQHPLLRPDVVDVVSGKNIGQQKLDVCYLDTTYLTPKYAFPSQEDVIRACADMCVSLSKEMVDENDSWEQTKKERAGSGMVKFIRKESVTIRTEEEDDVDAMRVNDTSGKKKRGRLLVIIGTYSIGKERICMGVARALNSKIYAPPNKQKICAALEDPELMARLTNDPLEAQVHMQMLMEIRAETLADYLTGYKPHFSRIVGFRPSGWNYRPPNSRFVESPAVQTVLHSDNWKSRYSMSEFVPQRGSTREASCFGVPYSEHSSFRELTMFCCALRIDKIIPTVNVGSAKSRERMKAWCEKWAMEKKKNGLYKVEDRQTGW
ncbi:MAG: hypothetical protein MMC33_008346 [Icmadophila ericetorum]|nr:hypothetical protein [Icmadophila ericetorum]